MIRDLGYFWSQRSAQWESICFKVYDIKVLVLDILDGSGIHICERHNETSALIWLLSCFSYMYIEFGLGHTKNLKLIGILV